MAVTSSRMKLPWPTLMPTRVETNMVKVAAIIGQRRESAMRWLMPKPTVMAPPPAINPAEGWPTRTPMTRQSAMAMAQMSGMRKEKLVQSKV